MSCDNVHLAALGALQVHRCVVESHGFRLDPRDTLERITGQDARQLSRAPIGRSHHHHTCLALAVVLEPNLQTHARDGAGRAAHQRRVPGRLQEAREGVVQRLQHVLDGLVGVLALNHLHVLDGFLTVAEPALPVERLVHVRTVDCSPRLQKYKILLRDGLCWSRRYSRQQQSDRRHCRTHHVAPIDRSNLICHEFFCLKYPARLGSSPYVPPGRK
mmetsp:Transcript_44173/g.84433  ORF Transcript_44173/g.84433 Transcript_44173/m.84433 type:complete len:216 (-) Transcript_44173:232-879(-)